MTGKGDLPWPHGSRTRKNSSSRTQLGFLLLPLNRTLVHCRVPLGIFLLLSWQFSVTHLLLGGFSARQASMCPVDATHCLEKIFFFSVNLEIVSLTPKQILDVHFSNSGWKPPPGWRRGTVGVQYLAQEQNLNTCMSCVLCKKRAQRSEKYSTYMVRHQFIISSGASCRTACHWD